MYQSEGIHYSESVLQDNMLEPAAISGISRIDSDPLILETKAFSDSKKLIETFSKTTSQVRVRFGQDAILYGGCSKRETRLRIYTSYQQA